MTYRARRVIKQEKLILFRDTDMNISSYTGGKGVAVLAAEAAMESRTRNPARPNIRAVPTTIADTTPGDTPSDDLASASPSTTSFASGARTSPVHLMSSYPSSIITVTIFCELMYST